MIFRILVAMLTCLPFCSPLQASWWDNMTGYFKEGQYATPPTIRLLVVHDVESVNLEVRGKYSLFDPYTNSYISSRFIGKNRTVQALSDGLKWGEAFPGLYQIRIRPDEASASTVINGREYEGDIYIYDIGGTISIVNQIPIESYVASTLVAYQERPIEQETLAALAITARTNAYFQAVNPKNTYWAIDAQKVNFRGRALFTSMVEEAVRLTRYMIMSHTGVYEGMATPFAAQFESQPTPSKETALAKISIEEANQIAVQGGHAAQILNKAFPNSIIMIMQYTKSQ
jgi:stage II sporulation protein D